MHPLRKRKRFLNCGKISGKCEHIHESITSAALCQAEEDMEAVREYVGEDISPLHSDRTLKELNENDEIVNASPEDCVVYKIIRSGFFNNMALSER